MVHATPQFTPAQLIESGRRAEAEGRLDLAVQFYRHLVEQFAEAVETAEAHGALGRIGTVRPRAAHWSGAQRQGGQQALWRQAEARRDHYRIGRALTVLVGAFGWLVALGGPGAVLAYVLTGAEGAGLPPAPGGLVSMAAIAGGLFIAGCGIVLAARIARAQFDQADATRELLALERAKLGLE
jgi:hypothetical protein